MGIVTINADEYTDAVFVSPFPNKRIPLSRECVDRITPNFGYSEQVCACLIDKDDYPHFCRWFWNEWTLNKFNCGHEHEYTIVHNIECDHLHKQGDSQMDDILSK